jgi:hypothetical protein
VAAFYCSTIEDSDAVHRPWSIVKKPEQICDSLCLVFVGMIGVSVRTGRMIVFSAAWLAVVPTAGPAQDHPAPEVERELDQLLRRRHRLVKIGQEIAERR